MTRLVHADARIQILIKENIARQNLCSTVLAETAIQNGEASFSSCGAVVADTGIFTGRSPKDRFVVHNDITASSVDWGTVNQPLSQHHFDNLFSDMCAYARACRLYGQQLYVGRDKRERKAVFVLTEYAWHNLFAKNLFVRDAWEEVSTYWTVINLPSFKADPKRHGSKSSTIIALDFKRRVVLIANTAYAGEIKKSLFAVMNFELPLHGILPMHCSANHDHYGNTALFFGLSGTGKTTLSADADHTLVGDDEHGWGKSGVFNFEGGCYAKTINLSEEGEPLIYAASNLFGTVLENVVLDSSRRPNFDDTSRTENTRSAYPLDFISNASKTGQAKAPQHIFFLTADASGVLPPLSRLSTKAAMYHFLSGYTSKLAGTERGVTVPEATFSTCFGGPFLPLPAGKYAKLLEQKIKRQNPFVWLVNTGWHGGSYGTGKRIRLNWTRAMIAAARSGELLEAPLRKHPIFNLDMVVHCPNVPDEVLDPVKTWKNSTKYEKQAQILAQQFVENFKQFESQVDPSVTASGPTIE